MEGRVEDGRGGLQLVGTERPAGDVAAEAPHVGEQPFEQGPVAGVLGVGQRGPPVGGVWVATGVAVPG